jgi:hypothetical protein
MSNGYVLGHSPPWPPNVARGISHARKWQALVSERPSRRIFRLVSDRELADDQKWEDLVVALGFDKEAATILNVGDIIYSLATGWDPKCHGLPREELERTLVENLRR